MEGSFEIGFSACIAISVTSRLDKEKNFGDMVAYILAYTAAVWLLAAPIYMLFKITKIHKLAKEHEQMKKQIQLGINKRVSSVVQTGLLTALGSNKAGAKGKFSIKKKETARVSELAKIVEEKEGGEELKPTQLITRQTKARRNGFDLGQKQALNHLV